jgi:hypothetical protein
MPEMVALRINGALVRVHRQTTVAAAIMIGGASVFRRSATGEARGPLCGMGICFECRATVNGQLHQRTCQLLARDGMEVRTDDAI